MNSILKISDKTIVDILLKIKDIIHTTKFEGHIYATDEFVRDAVLDRDPTNIILAVEMPQGARRFGDFLSSQSLINNKEFVIQKHDVLTFEFKEFPGYEITCSQTRKGRLGESVKDETIIHGTLYQDALLRSLSIDSVYYNISTDKIIDPTNNGLMDIFQKRLRTPQAPFIAFMVDSVNMVKVIRVSTELGWGIQKETWLSIVENARRLQTCNKEQFLTELVRIMYQDKPSFPFLKLKYSGLLEYCLPEIDSMSDITDDNTPDKTLFMHTMEVMDKTSEEDIVSRFAALFHDYGELVTHTYTSHKEKKSTVSAQFAELALKELGLGTSFIKKVLNVIENVDFFDACPDRITPSEKLIRKFIRNTGENFSSTLDVIQAENTSVKKHKKTHLVNNILKRYEGMLDKIANEKKPNLPINGNDIMAEFNIKGKIVGEILDEITDAYYENEAITKAECFNIAESYIRRLLV